MYGVILQGLKKKNHWSLLRSSHMALQRVTGIVFSQSIQPVTSYHTTGISFISITSAQNAVH